jgi:hypothetical protein
MCFRTPILYILYLNLRSNEAPQLQKNWNLIHLEIRFRELNFRWTFARIETNQIQIISETIFKALVFFNFLNASREK